MSEFWKHLFNRLKAIPVGIWAALGAAFAVLLMYLRGRRLEAELASEKLKTHAADAAASSARSEGRAQAHLQAAARHEARVEALQDKYLAAKQLDRQEQIRIEAMAPSEVTEEYLKLAEKSKNQP